jgi:cytochrome c556
MAKMAQENYDRQQTQEKLNQLLNNCVACHKTYKISV